MSLRSTDRQWGSVAKFFHWIMALAILVNGVWGLLMTQMTPSMSKIGVYAWHKSIGLTVLALLLLRLLWRAFDRRPRDEPGPRWQQLAAHAVHGVLYLMVAALPLTGWWFNSLRGFPLPGPIVQDIARRVAGADSTGALAVPLPPDVASIAIRPTGVVLYKRKAS